MNKYSYEEDLIIKDQKDLTSLKNQKDSNSAQLLAKIDSLQNQLIDCKICCNEKDQLIQQLKNNTSEHEVRLGSNNIGVTMDMKDMEIMRLQEECIEAKKHIDFLNCQLRKDNQSLHQFEELNNFKNLEMEKEIKTLSKNLRHHQLQLKHANDTLNQTQVKLEEQEASYKQMVNYSKEKEIEYDKEKVKYQQVVTDLNEQLSNIQKDLSIRDVEAENCNLKIVEKDNLILELRGKLNAQHQMLTSQPPSAAYSFSSNQSISSHSAFDKSTINVMETGKLQKEFDFVKNERDSLLKEHKDLIEEIGSTLGSQIQLEQLAQQVRLIKNENTKYKKRAEEVEKTSIELAAKLTDTVSANNILRQQLQEKRRIADAADEADHQLYDLKNQTNQLTNDLREIMDLLDINIDSCDDDIHQAIPHIVNKINQLSKKKVDQKMSQKSDNDALLLEKELTLCRQQLKNIKEELSSTRERLELAQLELDSQRLSSSRDEDLVVKNKKLMKLVEKYKIELQEAKKDNNKMEIDQLEGLVNKYKVQLRESQIEHRETKKQLTIANNKLQNHKAGGSPSYRAAHALERRVEGQEAGLKEMARRLKDSEDALASSRAEVAQLRARWDDASNTLAQEVSNCKQVIHELSGREQQLLELRLTIARMLGLDISKSTVADHVILDALEQLIYLNSPNNQKRNTTNTQKPINFGTNKNTMPKKLGQKSSPGRALNVDMKIY